MRLLFSSLPLSLTPQSPMCSQPGKHLLLHQDEHLPSPPDGAFWSYSPSSRCIGRCPCFFAIAHMFSSYVFAISFLYPHRPCGQPYPAILLCSHRQIGTGINAQTLYESQSSFVITGNEHFRKLSKLSRVHPSFFTPVLPSNRNGVFNQRSPFLLQLRCRRRPVGPGGTQRRLYSRYSPLESRVQSRQHPRYYPTHCRPTVSFVSSSQC